MKRWIASNREVTCCLAACAAASGLLWLALLYADGFWGEIAADVAVAVIAPIALGLSLYAITKAVASVRWAINGKSEPAELPEGVALDLQPASVQVATPEPFDPTASEPWAAR